MADFSIKFNQDLVFEFRVEQTGNKVEGYTYNEGKAESTEFDAEWDGGRWILTHYSDSGMGGFGYCDEGEYILNVLNMAGEDIREAMSAEFCGLHATYFNPAHADCPITMKFENVGLDPANFGYGVMRQSEPVQPDLLTVTFDDQERRFALEGAEALQQHMFDNATGYDKDDFDGIARVIRKLQTS